ncbi:MAG: cellulose binding domain-containing protein, partial [Eubacteriales bacterium]|nr:cellulose binding domain-containing protein [Eubacteriales bacterium]
MKLHKKTRQILVMVLIFAILCTMVPDTLITHAQAEQTQDQTHWYQATAKINASWGGHISGEITIKNISDQTRKGWQITLLWSNVAITSMWNGSCDQTDGTYLIRPTEYNRDLEAGASASIGFIAEGEDSLLNRLQSDTFFQETRASITTAEEREADYKTEITQAPAAESTEKPAGEPTNTPAPAEVSAPAPTAELEVPSIAAPEPTLESTEEPTAPITTESGETSTVQPTT